MNYRENSALSNEKLAGQDGSSNGILPNRKGDISHLESSIELDEGIEQSLDVAQLPLHGSTEGLTIGSNGVKLLDEESYNALKNVTAKMYGDPDGFADAYTLLQPKLLGFLIRKFHFLPEDAEQLAQDIHRHVWEKLPLYDRSKSEFPTWFFHVAHNMAIDQIRRDNRRPRARSDRKNPEEILIEIPASERDVADEVFTIIVSDRVREALAQLGESVPAQRQALEMAYFQGMTQREIAKTLGLPVGTIKTRIRLGLMKVEAILAKEKDALLGEE